MNVVLTNMGRRGKMKKIIFILLLNGLCAAAFAQNKSDFEFDPEDGAITGYTGSGSEVIIPDRIDGVPVKYISNSVFKDRNLTSVSIPDNVKGIGPQAFAGNKLEKVVIGNEVEMMTSAFSADFIRKYLDEPKQAGGTYSFKDDNWEYDPAGIRYLTPENTAAAAASQQAQNTSPINIVIHNYVGKQPPPGGMPPGGLPPEGMPADPANPLSPQTAPPPARNPSTVGDVMVMPGLPDPNGNKMYRLQVGAFNSQNAAANTFRSLQDAGFSPVYEHSQNFFRVIIADVPASSVAGTVQRLGSIGIKQIWVRE
jgi:hypothetical protein